jgi:hypothetical protein
MAYHDKIKTTVKQIVEYYSSNANELDMNIDTSDLSTHCWRCGEIRRLFRILWAFTIYCLL